MTGPSTSDCPPTVSVSVRDPGTSSSTTNSGPHCANRNPHHHLHDFHRQSVLQTGCLTNWFWVALLLKICQPMSDGSPEQQLWIGKWNPSLACPAHSSAVVRHWKLGQPPGGWSGCWPGSGRHWPVQFWPIHFCVVVCCCCVLLLCDVCCCVMFVVV